MSDYLENKEFQIFEKKSIRVLPKSGVVVLFFLFSFMGMAQQKMPLDKVIEQGLNSNLILKNARKYLKYSLIDISFSCG